MEVDGIKAIKFVFEYMNGLTEFIILMLMIYLDTILGSKWRYVKGKPRISKAAINGIMRQSGLALFVLLVYLSKIILEELTFDNLFIFDWITSISFYFIAKWFLVSIIANAKLAGYAIPKWAENLVSDEISSKEERG